MLAYILAIAVGLGSFALYMAAFFFPEIHRKRDFFWSGVGFFYALILWVCAGRITGAVLLGQLASVSLLVWFGWEALALRRASTPVEQQTPIPADVKNRLNGFLGRQSPVISPQTTPKINLATPAEPLSELNSGVAEPAIEVHEETQPEQVSPSPDVVEIQDHQIVEKIEEPVSSSETVEPEITVEEIPETPTVELTPVKAVTPTETPENVEEKPPISSGKTPAKTITQSQKSIPALVGMVSGLIGNFTGLLNKQPKTKTPKPTTPNLSQSSQPDPVSPTSTVVESTSSPTDSVTSEFAEFEDLETTISSTSEGVETETQAEVVVTEPETTETSEPVEKQTPSPFEEIISPQVEVVEITAEQVNLIVDDTQESVVEAISSVVVHLESENIEEVVKVSDRETATETPESEETIPLPLVAPNAPNPDLKAAAQKPIDPNSPSESKSES
ncbi:MAG: Ycf66 family protein [Planktothrix sp.]|uniref:Ycf66 family protein n=1 Tax=Planktothrix sp. TaxID=3088171 RepID=UPI0038D4A3BD